MAPMRKPPPARQHPWQETFSIDAFARQHGISRRDVKQLLRSGKLPFLELAGQIRVPRLAPLPPQVKTQ